MTNSIEVINLSKKYKSKNAVSNINFKIGENELLAYWVLMDVERQPPLE